MAIAKYRVIEILKKRDGLVCGICKKSLEKEFDEYTTWLSEVKGKPFTLPEYAAENERRKKIPLTIDHIIPKDFLKAKGLSPKEYNAIPNLQLTHAVCNYKKANHYAETTETAEVIESLRKLRPTVRISRSESIAPQPEERVVPDVLREVHREEQTEPEPAPISTYDFYKASYNAMAKVFNSLPGSQLLWPKDKFAPRYCYGHRNKKRELNTEWVVKSNGEEGWVVSEPKTCKHCGYPFPGTYDNKP